jgi:hypothetical protein
MNFSKEKGNRSATVIARSGATNLSLREQSRLFAKGTGLPRPLRGLAMTISDGT